MPVRRSRACAISASISARRAWYASTAGTGSSPRGVAALVELGVAGRSPLLSACTHACEQ